jgi:hypothetical protein
MIHPPRIRVRPDAGANGNIALHVEYFSAGPQWAETIAHFLFFFFTGTTVEAVT